MAEQFVLLTQDHEILGLNPKRGWIHCMTVQSFFWENMKNINNVSSADLGNIMLMVEFLAHLAD